jgi:peptidoglycan DL-endopeptidase CwlO
VSAPRTRAAARLTALLAVFVLVGVSVAAAAGPIHTQGAALDVLHVRTHNALLDLYALDTRLQTAQGHLTSLEAQTEQLRRQQLLLAQQLSATRRTLVVSQRLLGANLRTLYKRGDVNTLAIVLGAQSLDDVVTELDALSTSADARRRVVHATTIASTRLETLRRTLRHKQDGLAVALDAARRDAAALASARAERISFLGRLRTQERLKTRQLAALEAAAQRVERKSVAIQSRAAVVPAPVAAPAQGRTITVSSTGYALPGRTATGMPVGWGVVAVDPSTIPLGTKLTIPGYGEGVAADVGSGVRGASIDLWFPTLAQARAWGRRTVTITLH